MGNSQNKLRLDAPTAGSGPQPFLTILYRAALLVAAGACLASWPVVASAQEERPQITPGERKVPRKKDAGPRAVAVMQLAPNGKASLIPIAILMNGKFWDASAYKAAPVPMALEYGTVYEAERAGSSLGLFTVSAALHSNAANVPNPWIATGKWVPAGSDTGQKALQAEPTPVGIDTTDAPPRLTKHPQQAPPPTSPAPAAAPPSSSGSGSSSGDEPPRLTKPAPKDTPAASTTPPPAPQSGPKPVEATTDAKKADRPTSPESDSGADPGNRPRLRRGKPTESFADEEVPGYSQPGAAPPSTNTQKKPAPADTGPVQLIPAISDAVGPEPHSYAFEWLKGEEGERRQQMTALAKEQVRAYVEARAKARIASTTAANPGARHLLSKKSPEPILSNGLMTAFDLWSTNQPVVIFSAQAQMPPTPAGQSPAEPSEDVPYSILLVAYPDIYNNLHKLYAGITDKDHLDLTPHLELIDAVDADGDGRGELLFRETSDAGTGWVIYRATADKLWKMFDSLNPE